MGVKKRITVPIGEHPSGWTTGFFRVPAPGGSCGLEQMFRNTKTGEFKAFPFDADDEEWEPVYVYRGPQ